MQLERSSDFLLRGLVGCRLSLPHLDLLSRERHWLDVLLPVGKTQMELEDPPAFSPQGRHVTWRIMACFWADLGMPKVILEVSLVKSLMALVDLVVSQSARAIYVPKRTPMLFKGQPSPPQLLADPFAYFGSAEHCPETAVGQLGEGFGSRELEEPQDRPLFCGVLSCAEGCFGRQEMGSWTPLAVSPSESDCLRLSPNSSFQVVGIFHCLCDR